MTDDDRSALGLGLADQHGYRRCLQNQWCLWKAWNAAERRVSYDSMRNFSYRASWRLGSAVEFEVRPALERLWYESNPWIVELVDLVVHSGAVCSEMRFSSPSIFHVVLEAFFGGAILISAFGMGGSYSGQRSLNI